MRTTWLILLIMVLAGATMYYFATQKEPVAPYDTIVLHDTPDSIRSRLRLYAAYNNPTEITFRDSAWFQDSIPLKQVPLDSTIAFDKNYKSVTFFLDYDHTWFYDVGVNKPSPDSAYIIRFSVNMVKDTLRAGGIIEDYKHDQFRLSGPMMKMYQAFILTYNNGLPPATDSTQVTDSTREHPVTPPARMITVIRK